MPKSLCQKNPSEDSSTKKMSRMINYRPELVSTDDLDPGSSMTCSSLEGKDFYRKTTTILRDSNLAKLEHHLNNPGFPALTVWTRPKFFLGGED